MKRARSRGSLIAATNASGIGLNVIAGDQYVADVLPARMFRTEFARRGLAPQVLSRAVEDSGTVTSPLVPWNSCGAYMAGVNYGIMRIGKRMALTYGAGWLGEWLFVGLAIGLVYKPVAGAVRRAAGV